MTVRWGRPLTAVTRLASLPCHTLWLKGSRAQGSRLKTPVCRRTTFCLKFAFFQLRRRRCRSCRPRLDGLLLRRLSFSFSTRLDVLFVLVFVVVVLCRSRRAPLPLEPTLRLHRSPRRRRRRRSRLVLTLSLAKRRD